MNNEMRSLTTRALDDKVLTLWVNGYSYETIGRCVRMPTPDARRRVKRLIKPTLRRLYAPRTPPAREVWSHNQYEVARQYLRRQRRAVQEAAQPYEHDLF